MLDGEDENEIILDEVDQDEEQEEAQTGADEGGEGEEENELTIEIDGYQAEEEEEKPLVKRLRDEIRERDRRLAQYAATPQVKKIEVGEEPTLEDAGIDWDPDKFKAAWSAWNDRKQQADKQQQEEAKASEAAQERWNGSYQTYRQHATKLGVSDYDEVEKSVASAMPVAIQNAIPLYFGEKGPQVVLALGRHPKLLEEIVSMNDPVAQLLRLKEIAMGVKVNVRKNTPAPERASIPSGSAAVTGSSDKTLEKLEKEADKTGDRSKLIDYRRKMKAR